MSVSEKVVEFSKLRVATLKPGDRISPDDVLCSWGIPTLQGMMREDLCLRWDGRVNAFVVRSRTGVN